jgi:hypothetical protein
MPGHVFISYSRKDKKWMEILQEDLRVLKIDVWADDRIESGELWREKIEQALESAKVAVLLVSRDFLISDFINKYELPVLLKAAAEERITLLWVAVAPCLVEATEIIKYQAANNYPKTLGGLAPVRRDEEIYNIILKIKAAVEKSTPQSKINPVPVDGRKAAASIAQSDSNPQQDNDRLWQEEGNAVPLGSPFYIKRNQDDELTEAILMRAANVRIEGVRQVGKTSLLSRGMEVAREAGAKVINIDCESLDDSVLESLNSLCFELARRIADELELSSRPDPSMKLTDTPKADFERYIKEIVLGKNDDWIVWVLDQVDKLIERPYMKQFFALLRTWVNARATFPRGPWKRLTLLISYSTEPNIFFDTISQSILSVGSKLTLDEFTVEQVRHLNTLYGSPLRDERDIKEFHRFVGGHPFLVNRGLYVMRKRAAESGVHEDLESFKAESYLGGDLYGNHLRRLLGLIKKAGIGDAVRQLIAGKGLLDTITFHRLRYGGLISGDSLENAQIRCELYTKYLKKHLLENASKNG